MTHNITVEGGTSVRLTTAGKYCDRDIVVTAGGGGSGGSVETCTVTISGTSLANYDPVNVAYTSVDDSGKVIGVNQTVSESTVRITCVKGSTLAVRYKAAFSFPSSTINASLLFYASPVGVYKLNDDATTATINNGAGAGSLD